MSLEFVRIKSEDCELYKEVLRLYEVSFPYHEQRSKGAQATVLGDEEYHFDAILHEGSFAGAALYWQSGNFVYVEHFCILEQLRGNGIGTASLEKLCTKGLVILEIDPPVDEISLRRKGFYERAGFYENPYKHVHPPYHAECAGHDLVVMTNPRPISEEEYLVFADYLKERVMKYV